MYGKDELALAFSFVSVLPLDFSSRRRSIDKFSSLAGEGPKISLVGGRNKENK